jgi:bifunctional DNA-binding transcriptional regulator/antitoxin component of YhaV-PrlF toxin-antitoxin module
MPTAKITADGRIDLPPAVLDGLGARPGDRVLFVPTGQRGAFLLVVANRDVRELKGMFGIPKRVTSIEEMRPMYLSKNRR